MCIRLVACLLALISAAPAHAHTGPRATKVTWDAVPCAVACADSLENGFSPCEAPFPPGSYADIVTSPAPAAPEGKVTIVEAWIEQLGDWELYICDESGVELGRDDIPFLEYCQPDGPAVITPIGPFVCHEDLHAVVAPGAQMTLRAYNVAAVGAGTGQYWFLFI